MTRPTGTLPPSAVSVVGLGKLGLPLAACLSASGFRTIGVDVIARNVAEINAGRSPILEPGLAELVRAHGGSALRATTNVRDAIAETEVTFIIVQTPSDESGGFSNALLREAIDQIGVALSDSRGRDHLVVVSSTVMPGSIDRELGPLLAASSGRPLGDGVDICYDPDFISLGEVVRGLREPELVLIGEHRAASGDIVEAIHRRMAVNQPHVARMSVVSAEITKLALNAYVTMKISFANNLANICSGIAGADVDAITAALGADSRISPRYLSAGLSFGGTCFPRDTVAFRRLAACAGTTAPLMEATEQVNREHARRLSVLVRDCQRPSGGAVRCWGSPSGTTRRSRPSPPLSRSFGTSSTPGFASSAAIRWRPIRRGRNWETRSNTPRRLPTRSRNRASPCSPIAAARSRPPSKRSSPRLRSPSSTAGG